MKRMSGVFGVVLALGLLTGSCAFAASELQPDPENTLYLDLDYGRVVIRMRPDLAPQHVARIKNLVRDGFYDGTVFHRVVDGFVAQTGDPTGKGSGGTERKLKPEFTRTPQTRGIVSMARGSKKDSADSQFFFVLTDNNRSSLDGQYTVWGEVMSGMEFVDMIKKGDKTVGKVTNPDRVVKMQVMADAGRPAESTIDALKKPDAVILAADFSASEFRCTAMVDHPGSATQAALARLWAHGYLAGFYKAQGKITFTNDTSDSGILATCTTSPALFLLNASQQIAKMPRDLPASNDAFAANTYSCKQFVAARNSANKIESELADLWSFAVIQGYKNLAQPSIEIPVDARPQLLGAIARACEKSPDFLLLDMAAAVASKVKLK